MAGLRVIAGKGGTSLEAPRHAFDQAAIAPPYAPQWSRTLLAGAALVCLVGCAAPQPVMTETALPPVPDTAIPPVMTETVLSPMLDTATLPAITETVVPPSATATVSRVPLLDSLPVVPRIDSRLKAELRAIYERGLAQGNRPFVFSKIGDSITDAPAFLQSLGAGPINFGEYTDLASIVKYYRQTVVREHEGQPENSFQLHSLAVRSGWRASDLLAEGGHYAEPLCEAAETPLECELRNTRPAVALILIGANDVDQTPLEEYRLNLDEIVTLTLSYGVIPVLSTLSPQTLNPVRAELVLDYNQVVLDVAQAHHLPVWNFWRALQSLPGLGLSEDGLHPSQNDELGGSILSAEALQYGYAMRSLTALQVLAKIKAVVLDDGPPDR